jgi:hypothetical protein
MGLDAPRLALLLLGDSILDLCWLQRFIGSLPRVVYCKMHRYETLTKCNTWGAKYNMLHHHEHLNHINPYTLFY